MIILMSFLAAAGDYPLVVAGGYPDVFPGGCW